MAQTFAPKPGSQKHAENRHGTRSYRGYLRSMLDGNVVRSGQMARTTPRVEKKALKVVMSEAGYVGFLLTHGRRMGKYRAVMSFLVHWGAGDEEMGEY